MKLEGCDKGVIEAREVGDSIWDIKDYGYPGQYTDSGFSTLKENSI